MGGVVNSLGGFLGTSSGPQAAQGQFSNGSLTSLTDQANAASNPQGQAALQGYANGTQTADQVGNTFGAGASQEGLNNALATGATTGTKYAADQMNQNATQSSLYGSGGELGQAQTALSGLMNQGYNLQPQDQSLYGQEAGSVARQFGQQGSAAASDLASRGLSDSGAAGAQFSGLQGSQNEMLAGAQQQIAQQRFTNTMNQIGQYQNFTSNLGNQYNSALNQQYGRQLSGAQNETSNLSNASSQTQNQNGMQNQYGLQAQQFNVANKPANFLDTGIAGASSAVGAGSTKAGQNAGSGLFSGSSGGSGASAAMLA